MFQTAKIIAFPSAAVTCSFDSAWAVTPTTMKTRSESRAKLRPLWAFHAKRCGGQDRLEAAFRAYLKGDKDLPKSGGPGLQVWLRAEKYDHWLEGTNSVVSDSLTVEGVTRSQFPQTSIRDACIASIGLGWTISYLDRCGIAEGPNGPVLTVKSPTAAERLREKAKELKALGLYGIRLTP